ncbi:MAG: N-acetylglucosamine-6-phosphate deacetylase [Vicinamibacterales bacterium]
MIILSGADIVLPDRILSPGTVAIDGEIIVEVSAGARAVTTDDRTTDLAGHFVLPGFIDVHVHGVEGTDTLDDEHAIRRMADRLPRFGVTAFCPTSIACTPSVLRRLLTAVRECRTRPAPSASRVLPAHLESNFISPDYSGAQPLECLRLPRGRTDGEFTGDDILQEISAARPDVGMVTIAPELDGALDLIRDLVRHGHQVSLGHSGASYDEALAGIEAGARQATHLFNRMTPINHRQPGLAAAVLDREEIVAEVVCDGVHVHPSMVRLALSAKQPSHVMAITDGTAGAGLPRGSRTTIGGRPITVGDVALLEDGTIAGSVLTMDRAFARLVAMMGIGMVDAATICATTPARALGLHGLGVVAPGAIADLVVLDRNLNVTTTFIAGKQVYPVVGALAAGAPTTA